MSDRPDPPAGAAATGPAAEIPPGLTLPTRRKIVIMLSIMTTLFLAALDQTIMGVALPRVIGDLGGLDLYAWPITSYLLASTALVPVIGRLSDLYGRKPFVLIGIVIFVGGSALAGAAGSMWELIGFRAVQGLGAAFIMANAFTALGDYFAPAERGRWMGLVAATFALASVIGPLAGGVITDELSWRWVFYINVPVGAVSFLAVLTFMPWYRSARKLHVDYRGGALLVGTTVPLLLGFSWAGSQYAWGDPRVIGAFSISAVLLVVFLLAERGLGESAILPLIMFKQRAYAVASVVMLVVGVGMFGTIQFMPLFLQGAQGVSATSSGTITMPMSIGIVIGAVITGQVISRTGGYRMLALTGGLAMVAGPLLLSTLGVDSPQLETSGYMVLTGIAVGTAMPLYSLIVQNSLPYRLLGVGVASNQFIRQIGGTIGIAVFGALFTSGFATQLAKAFPDGLERLKQNPQILLDPRELTLFRDQLEADAPGRAETVIATARGVIATEVTDLFLIAAACMVVGFVAALLLPKIRFASREELLQGMHQAGGERRSAAALDDSPAQPDDWPVPGAVAAKQMGAIPAAERPLQPRPIARGRRGGPPGLDRHD